MKRAGWTPRKLSALVGVHVTTVYRWLRDESPIEGSALSAILAHAEKVGASAR